MQVPETPGTVEELDLMKRLRAYAEGTATWSPDGALLGPDLRRACQALWTNLVQLVNGVFAFLLDRVTTREMECFTLHDRIHGRKAAHLMWHITEPSRRERLTPPEIAMLVVAAHFHDLGMGLSPEERARRLDPASDLWIRSEISDSTRRALDRLRHEIGDATLPEPTRIRATRELLQAEEALLCEDTRERHATRARYEELLGMLADFHSRDPEKIPDIEACLAFDGDSFRRKVIDVCVSHNEDAEVLVGSDPANPARPRFPIDYPVGRSIADLHFVAAALRLADILDCDRERTPAVLFHYLLPTSLRPKGDRSIVEWSKHLAISNWHIESDALVFRGRCRDPVVHHAIVLFAGVIADEIGATRATFGALGEARWPFVLPTRTMTDIHEEGYRYVPYRFELDDERVYELLMGGAIYKSRLVALRELIQNAVDACKLRDTLMRLYEPHVTPGTNDRITVRYVAGSQEEPARLVVADTGIGMDAWVLERWFLKVGRSYYGSPEFQRTRVELRRGGMDFAPVSEFGIGFLSVFLLADHVEVETAMSEPMRGDARKRTLFIDGPTRLIRLHDERNEGPGRFRGTRITLVLRTEDKAWSDWEVSWEQIKQYLLDVCQEVPYRINLEYVVEGGHVFQEWLDPRPLRAEVHPEVEERTVRIRVDDAEFGLEGEIALSNPYEMKERDRELAERGMILGAAEAFGPSVLLRGGFKVGNVLGLPSTFVTRTVSTARLRLTWERRADHRYIKPNLARDGIAEIAPLAECIQRAWLSYLLEHIDELPRGQLYHLGVDRASRARFGRWLERFDAYRVYRLARNGWETILRSWKFEETALARWESGEGGPLPLGPFRHELHWELLDLILPRICRLTMAPEARFAVYPPIQGWREITSEWKDYVSAPVSWGRFVEYTGSISHLLVYEYPGSCQFNVRFRDRLTTFEESEQEPLFPLLAKLADARGNRRPTHLSPSERALFSKAQDLVGDLKIGELHGAWRIDTFGVVSEGPP